MSRCRLQELREKSRGGGRLVFVLGLHDIKPARNCSIAARFLPDRNVSMILRHLQLEFSEAVHHSLLWPQAAD
jgi:hypothetical protein